MKVFLRYIFFGTVAFFALVGVLFSAVFVGMRFGIFNVAGSIAERNQFFAPATTTPVDATVCTDVTQHVCSWTQTPQWAAIKGGLIKDKDIIARVSEETGVSGRMLAAVVVPEQTRFFTAEREVFKSYFEPLKILGSLTQFSLGVSGIKEETAKMIELYAASTTSPFFPGEGMSELIAYPPTVDHDSELYARLTNSKDHYYSYLYTALYIKEVEAQWQKAGFEISRNPNVVVTLFNLGFNKSQPNINPSAGGAPITSGGTVYTYGELGTDFYNSDELIDIFPK